MKVNARPELVERGKEFESLLRERILVLDGAMGTLIQQQHLSAVDFGGEQYDGCNEHLALTRPDVIRSIYGAYYEAGADIVQTDTFGGTPLVLAEYGLQDRALAINEAAARIARQVAVQFPGPRFVAGSMGPTTKAISVTGGVTFDQMVEHYRIQALGLLRGGADLLLLETIQDTLNAKAGIIGIELAGREIGHRVPLILSATIERSGAMLAGQTIDAFYASTEHSGMTAIGLNCATGPEFMTDHIRTLSRMASCFVSCHPNAGMPDENSRYTETPERLAGSLNRFIEQGWINLIGGCCGTTPDHIRAITEVARGGKPRALPKTGGTHVSGIDYVPSEESSRPLIVGERTNVNGSRRFRELIAAEKFEEAAEIARRQVRAGAQIIDVCLTSTERDEASDLDRFLKAATKIVKAPFMIDSMDSRSIEVALKHLQGKAIINSINLEEGEERFKKIVPLIHRYGAAVIVGCINEQGQAIATKEKLKIAERSYTLLTQDYGLKPEDIIWDALVFPCASGDKNYVGSAAHTIEAVRLLKESYPQTRTLLGISNVSFGLPEAGREVLNAVFLYHATKAGLDFAIVSSEKLVRYAGISDEERKLSEELLFNRGADPIGIFAAYYRGRAKKTAADVPSKQLPLDERLARYIIDGSKEGLIQDLDEKLKTSKPIDIINGPLMKGMEEVGRLFNNNELIVAEVLQSAEVMKAAVANIEKFMGHTAAASKGRIVLATVKGDVHDIGKNLVEIILSNNGYSIINLGIKVPPEAIVKAALEEKPDLIGLSGLLVKSAQQMVATVQDLKAAGITIPVLVGGAALTRKFTVARIHPAYGSTVAYAKDVMNGLDLANQLLDPGARAEIQRKLSAEVSAIESPSVKPSPGRIVRTCRSASIKTIPPRRPPNLSCHVIEEPVEALWPYINRQMLYGKHLGLRGVVESLAASKDSKFQELEAVIQEVQALAESGWMNAKGIYQYFSANSKDNDVIIYDDADNELARFTFPRQPLQDGLCLADFVAPEGSGRDSVAMLIVTSGIGIRERAACLKENGAYLLSHALQALALESAEAFAEKLHRRIRAEWGIGDPPGMPMHDLFKTLYTGIRMSFGYPACPNIADQDTLWRLLKPQEIGIQLTEGYMMDPEASVSAVVFHHPQARYFDAGTEA